MTGPLGPPSRPPANDSGDSRRRGRSHSGGKGRLVTAPHYPPRLRVIYPALAALAASWGARIRDGCPSRTLSLSASSLSSMICSAKRDMATQQPRSLAIRRKTVGRSRVGAQPRLEDSAVIVPLSATCQSVIRRVLVVRAAAVAPRRRLPPDATQVIPEAANSGDHLRQAEGEPAIPARRPFTENGQKRPDNAALPMFWEGKPLEPFGFHALPGLAPRHIASDCCRVPRLAEIADGGVNLRLHLREEMKWGGTQPERTVRRVTPCDKLARLGGPRGDELLPVVLAQRGSPPGRRPI